MRERTSFNHKTFNYNRNSAQTQSLVNFQNMFLFQNPLLKWVVNITKRILKLLTNCPKYINQMCHQRIHETNVKGNYNRVSKSTNDFWLTTNYLLLAQDPVLVWWRGWRSWDRRCWSPSPDPLDADAAPVAADVPAAADVDPPRQWLCPVPKRFQNE